MPSEIIILTDDEAEDRAWMSEALATEGYTVVEAGDYESTLAAYDRYRWKIALLIVDVSLPGKNGCEIAKMLLSRDPTLRVLFISGHVGAEVCAFYGIDVRDLFFLRKPFTPEQLTRRVRQVLASEEQLPSVIARAGGTGG